MSRLADLKQQVAKYKCERCGFDFLVEELYEETETGLIVCKKDLDELGFNEQRRDAAADPVEHHFDT